MGRGEWLPSNPVYWVEMRTLDLVMCGFIICNLAGAHNSSVASAVCCLVLGFLVMVVRYRQMVFASCMSYRGKNLSWYPVTEY